MTAPPAAELRRVLCCVKKDLLLQKAPCSPSPLRSAQVAAVDLRQAIRVGSASHVLHKRRAAAAEVAAAEALGLAGASAVPGGVGGGCRDGSERPRRRRLRAAQRRSGAGLRCHKRRRLGARVRRGRAWSGRSSPSTCSRRGCSTWPAPVRRGARAQRQPSMGAACRSADAGSNGAGGARTCSWKLVTSERALLYVPLPSVDSSIFGSRRGVVVRRA